MSRKPMSINPYENAKRSVEAVGPLEQFVWLRNSSPD